MSKINEEKNKTVGGMLYLVATPIGNMADITERAKKVLREVDFVAAEDTRNSGKLLACLEIKQEIVSYFEHNKRERGEVIVSRLQAGESCALITDAGMPAISDPGADLVSLCAEHGVPVTVIPGCCAAVTALALSALPTARFAFEGFLPTDNKTRRERLSELENEQRTMILYEAPHRLTDTLAHLRTALGERRISICRELTKINEEIIRTTLDSAIAFYRENKPRGEYVLILEGGESLGIPVRKRELSPVAGMSGEEMVAYFSSQGMERMDAIKTAAKQLGISKSELYRQLHKA
ncbi:MAG: 16S rRNA (cytidine(1402)-2'-O)-methyltransferase [Clostridia bacterium]|nr:16S rRNA (cytidine(1402)-2'-O)-methyltransferase [Clostridia bacterium]